MVFNKNKFAHTKEIFKEQKILEHIPVKHFKQHHVPCGK